MAAADEASEILSNTRTVARSSYIHASIIKAYEQGKLKRLSSARAHPQRPYQDRERTDALSGTKPLNGRQAASKQ